MLGQSLHSTQEVLRNHARQPPLPSEAPTTVVGLCLAQSAARLNFEMAISLDVFFANNSLKLYCVLPLFTI